jgi:two-component system, OmpR family, sensor kinase
VASLRARLVAALLGVAAAGLLVLGAVTYLEQRSFLYQRVEDQARAAAGPLARQLDDDGPERGAQRGGPGDGPRDAGLPAGVYGELRDAQGRVIGRGVLDPFETGVTAEPEIPAGLEPGEEATVGGDRDYRVFATQEDGGTLIVAVPLTDTQTTLSRLLLVESLVIAAVLLFLAAVAWVIVRIGLRPLDRMAGTAARIAGGDLSHRVADPDPRTETGRLGTALNRMLDRLEEAFHERERSEQRLRQFLADASHELRTPLTSIRGYAELYRRGMATGPDDVDKAMRRIEDEATRMGVLVEDMLALGRLEEIADAPHRRVDLAALARDAVDDARATDPSREINAHAPNAVPVHGDADQLRQVLANLIRNALVHTPAGTPIDVTVGAANGTGRLEVRDHGAGLPTDDPSVVFERFWRAAGGRKRDRGGAGAGLGLAIVAAVADAHSGRASAANAPGGGASFVVELPTTEEPPTRP